jgi:hypothetical protein
MIAQMCCRCGKGGGILARYFSPDGSKQQVWLHRTCRKKWFEELRGPRPKKGPLKELPPELAARLPPLPRDLPGWETKPARGSLSRPRGRRETND